MLGWHFQKMEHSLPLQEFFIHGSTSAYYPLNFVHPSFGPLELGLVQV